MKAKVAFKSYNQNDLLLIPPTLGDLIPSTHQVRIVSDIVDRLDISDIEATYLGGGASSYHPRMLLKVIFYGYMNNIYSGRQLEKALCENIHFMWLSGMSRPDFRTLNLFRGKRISKERFDSLFTQVVELLHEEGLVSLKVQYIDGTKIESCANKYTFVWKGSVEKNKAKLEANIKNVLAAAEQIVEEESQSDYEQPMSPDEYAEKADNILRKMDEKGLSDKKLRKSVEKVKTEHAPKMKEYEEHLEVLGERNSYSKTDHDATFMRMKEDAMNNGQTKPGYNVQIATENQYITNYGIYWRPNDQGTLIPFLQSFSNKYGIQSDEIVADSGYGSEMNYEYMWTNDIIPYVKYNRFHAEDKRKYVNDPFLPANMFYNPDEDYYVCPMGQHLSYTRTKVTKSDLGHESKVSIYRSSNCRGCPLRSMCYNGTADYREIVVNHKADMYKSMAKSLLTSPRGLHHRSTRPIEPEAVFGDIKHNHHFKRFRMKSAAKVAVEFGLVALAHNLRKYVSYKANEKDKQAKSMVKDQENAASRASA